MGFITKKEINEKGKKMTGRELFMLDKSLNESDLKFLEEGMVNKVYDCNMIKKMFFV